VENAISKIGPQEVIRVGGAGHKALLVLEATADVYLFATKGTKKWDTCAPEAIIRAVGGVLTDKHGNKLPYFANSEFHNLEGVLCAMKDHQKYVDKLKS